MLGLVTPNAYYISICQINISNLKAQGVKVLLFDLDNTITTWNSPKLDAKVVAWFKELVASGIKGCILSNNSAERICRVADELGIAYVARAKKPLPGGYKRAMAFLQSDKTNTIMVGDQLYTDMLGANLAGIKCFLVKPISLDYEFKGTKVNRLLEKPLLKTVIKRSAKKSL